MVLKGHSVRCSRTINPPSQWVWWRRIIHSSCPHSPGFPSWSPHHTSQGSWANAHAHREPQAGALACNRPPIQGAVCLTTLLNLEPASAVQSVLEPTLIDLSVLEVISTLKPSPKTNPPSLLPSGALALPLDILPESFSALQLYWCSHCLMATQVHPNCDIQPSGFTLALWGHDSASGLGFTMVCHSFESTRLLISQSPTWSFKPVMLPWSTIHWLHSSGTSSVFQSTGSTMVSFPANSSMDLHHYGSTIRSSPPPAPPWSLHLLPPPLGFSSTAVVPLPWSFPPLAWPGFALLLRLSCAPELQGVWFCFSFNTITLQLYPCFDSFLTSTTPWNWFK